MSELDLGALGERGKDHNDEKAPTPMQEVNAALKEAGFGMFHVRLLFATFLPSSTGVLTATSTSYLLTSAECDLNMNLEQKGLLNAIIYIGMLFSCVVAGFLIDVFGRKMFVIWGLAASYVCIIVSASSQTFIVLACSKFFEGFVFASFFTATVTLTSEFCHDGIRDRILLFTSSYASIASVIIAGMSWGILSNDWTMSFFGGRFVLHTWNFYLYIMSLWPLLGCLFYLFIPESPKYLVTQEKYSEARRVLINVYKQNTGKSEDTFVYKDLWKKQPTSKSNLASEVKVKESFARHIVVALHKSKPLFQGRLLVFLVLICFMSFVIMAVYNTLRLWFPQVSTIIEHSSFEMEDGSTRDLCMLLDSYTSNLTQTSQVTNVTSECVPRKSGTETYINTIIIGASCSVPPFLSSILVARVGKKSIQVVSALIAFGSTLGLRYTSSKVAVVALYSVSIAISQSTLGLYQVCTCEYLPTNMRSLGISVMLVMGRVGSLLGNILFPVMLKSGCTVPFYTMAGLILCVVVMSIFLPTKKKT